MASLYAVQFSRLVAKSCLLPEITRVAAGVGLLVALVCDALLLPICEGLFAVANALVEVSQDLVLVERVLLAGLMLLLELVSHGVPTP
jgi:hypothetical protein